MPDPMLFSLIHKKQPVPLKNKNKFVVSIDEAIKKLVDELLAEEEGNGIKFESLIVRRARLEQKIHNSTSFTEFSQHVSDAITILWKEGPNFLGKEEYLILINGLFILKKKLDLLDPNDLNDAALQEILKLPSNCGKLIHKIAIEKFDQKQSQESLSLLIFLTMVNSDDPDYWFRLGLVAQNCKNYPLALWALQTTAELAPDFIGTHIFAAYCHFEMQAREEALAELAESKKILNSTNVEDKWQQHLINIETLLQTSTN